MKIYLKGQKIEEPKPSIALGNFDGMHAGHIEVIKSAQRNGDSFGVLLFKTHTSETLGRCVKILTPLYRKMQIIEHLGADFVYLADFDERFKNLSCIQFAEFINSIGAKCVSVGYDYRCGKGGTAGVDELGEALAGFGITIAVTPQTSIRGKPIKSTDIRELLAKGNLKEANELMYEKFRFRGRVERGLQNGRLIGFPTANIEVASEELALKDGVYYARCLVSGKWLPSMVNIGKNPTFNAENRTVEVHIIDYDGNLYDDYIDVEFYDFIREDIKFDSVDELSAQLEKDKAEIISKFGKEV